MKSTYQLRGTKRKSETSMPECSSHSNANKRYLDLGRRTIFSLIGKGKPEFSNVLAQNCNLPEEIWIKIFEFAILGHGSTGFRNLLNLCQVCLSWRNLIVSSPRFWRVIDLSEIRPTNRNDILSLCDMELFKHTTHLSLAGWGNEMDRNTFAHLLKKCGNLLGLDVGGCYKFDGHSMSLLINLAPHLEEIDLSKTFNGKMINNSRKNPPNLSQFPLFPNLMIEFIEKRGKDLKSINLSENRINQINLIFKAIVNCPSLQLLDLSNIDTHSTFCIASDSLLESCPQLRVLRLCNVAIKPYKKIESGLPNLEELCLPNSICESAINDQILNGFACHSTKLRLLDIRGSSRVTSNCLLKLPATDLQYLSIDNCTHIFSYGLELVIDKWKHSLKNIDASQNFYPQGIEEGINLLVQNSSSPLETLNLRGSSLSFDAVIKLVLSCRRLRMVDLQSCRALPRGTKRLFRNETEIKELRKFIYDEKHLR
ncbi:F-box/LRR-repeat protein 6-like isoform X1 [Brevipalpus obovatus]|uniref:F-box/LRR-repeat protein 6-like isoform X1 n=1 Tax=Brevipalpus obovatus TaxID=246614 RepID=UPI003D9E413A